ncbi:MAG: hypothetical protein M0Q44_01110 [Methylobacter sp.]|jgi:hypothetical protein|nr:hypothetical protein [Methylobacter sp.]
MDFPKSAFLKTLTAALPNANVIDKTKTSGQRAELLELISQQPKRKRIVALGSGALYNGDMK